MSAPPPNEGVIGRPGLTVFAFETGNENFDFQRHETDDEKIVGAQICAAAGKHPVEDFAVLQHLPSGEIESIRPTESVTLRAGHMARFFVIEGASSRRFTIDGLNLEWPKATLAVRHAKFLVGAQPGDVLVLDREDGDVVLDEHGFIDLDDEGVERLKVRKRPPEPKLVEIYVNGTEYSVPKGKISYEQLLTLIDAPALPENQRYSVQYSKGQPGKPTGTLIEGESVEVKKGMEFDVTPANRS